MSSSVDIVNLALQQLGEPPINSFTDDRKAARTMNLLYAPCRDALLRMHPWNFAVTRRKLAQLNDPPLFGFAHVYAKPSDFLRLLKLNDGRTKFSIESDGIHTNADEVRLTYVARIEDATRYDPLFVFALAALLAANAAVNITSSQALEDRAFEKFREKLQEARSVDAVENWAQTLLGETFIEAFVGDDEPFRPIEPLVTP